MGKFKETNEIVYSAESSDDQSAFPVPLFLSPEVSTSFSDIEPATANDIQYVSDQKLFL